MRWYDPETGRFASEDPARDGVNWYAYIYNNPLVLTDPTGLDPHRMTREEADQRGWSTNPSSSPEVRTERSGGGSGRPDHVDNPNKDPHDVGLDTGDNRELSDLPQFGSEESKEAFMETPVGDVADEVNDLVNVMAPAPGEIFSIRNYADISEYGNYVVVKHNDGKFSILAHLKEAIPELKEGQEVAQGDIIATAGGTGTIPNMADHLHWSVFDGVDKLSDKSGDKGIFLGDNWVVNKDKSVDPQLLVDSGGYIHPSAGEITSEYGKRKMSPPRDFHEGVDYSLRTRRKQ